MTRFFAGLLVVGAGAVTAGCSSSYDTPSASETTGPPAVCSSTDSLQASVADLRDVQVVENGTAAAKDAVASVRAALDDVVQDAGSQYATQVDGLQASFDTVQAAVDSAVATPSTTTLSAVSASVSALASAVSDFADDVASTC
jgi:hypothetical protein